MENLKPIVRGVPVLLWGWPSVCTNAYRIDAKGFIVEEWSCTDSPSLAELDPLAVAPKGSKVAVSGVCVVENLQP